jgi:hypothetical protein
MKKSLVQPLLFESYLAAIANSPKSRIFRNFYARINDKKIDITKNGELSCAFFVSFILFYFGQIKKGHVTVSGTVADLQKNGWHKTKRPVPGAVIVWALQDFGRGDLHRHIGFYVGKQEAISNNYKLGYPTRHHWTSKNKRKVEAVFVKRSFISKA